MAFNTSQPETLDPAHRWGDDPLGRLSVWVDARLPAPQMLRALAEEYGGRAAPALEKMADRVEAGDDLRQAYEATRGLLPRRLAKQLTGIATSEDLAAVLPALAAQREETRRFSRQAMVILAYPVLVAVAAFLILLLFATLIVPQFASIYNDFGLQLPAITSLFVQLAPYIPWIGAAVGALAAIVFAMQAFEPTARLVHWLATGLPILGRLWVAHGHYSFSQLMATFTAAGMRAPAALRAAAAGLTDRNLAHAAAGAAARCESGQAISAALGASRHFERSLTALVGWGESHNSLPTAFTEASTAYRIQSQHLLTLVRRVVPSVLFVTVIFIVAILIVALFVPMVSMIQNLT
jgi:type II secretory pathway component PulF